MFSKFGKREEARIFYNTQTINTLKVLLSSAVAAALVFGFAGCKTDEDEDGIITQIEKGGYTNDTDVEYKRAYISTATKHLAADCEITIDTKKSTGKYTMGYIFNQIGKGSDDKPYSFCEVGVRYYNKKPQYFISYYTGVRGKKGTVNDFSTNAGDFDVSESETEKWGVEANSAKEYEIVKSWTDIPAGSYTLGDDGILKVYIDLTVLSGETEITKDNYGEYLKKGTITEVDDEDEDGTTTKVKRITNGSYKVTLKSSSDAASGTSKVISNSNTLESFVVQEAKLGKYAMVHKDATVSGTWNFPKDLYIKAAYAPDSDIIIWEQEIHN